MNPIHHLNGHKGRRRGGRGRQSRHGRASAGSRSAPQIAAPQPNNYAFIDSQNVHRGIREQGWELDWKKFRDHLRTNLGVTKALLFIGHIDGNEALYDELKAAGFDLIFKETIVIRGKDGTETVKGNVDADLVLHAMIEHNNYDKAVIATGDGDFHSLAKHLHSKGKLGKLVVPHGKKSSKLLHEFEEQLESMDGLRKTLEASKESAKPARTPDTATVRKPAAKKGKAKASMPALHPVW
jgi:uncharacterized LabA/DUF88 family protein